jgi:hypothetical protein
MESSLLSSLSLAIGQAAIASDKAFKARQRFHQAWWRTVVLAAEQGNYTRQGGEVPQPLGNAIVDGETSLLNFWPVGTAAQAAIERTQHRLQVQKAGLMEAKRLYNNLLSSQPLCFMAFEPLNQESATLNVWLTSLLSVQVTNARVEYEYAPGTLGDHSAFDVVFHFEADGKPGLFGLEVKYTDEFSYANSGKFYGEQGSKGYERYHQLYQGFASHFVASYDDFVRSKEFNQLFRNELNGLCQRERNAEVQVWTGLFHHPGEPDVHTSGARFAQMLSRPERFINLSYADYIASLQRIELPWSLREALMTFWVRYCAQSLSEKAYSAIGE